MARILIIDDMELVLSALCQTLELDGHNVSVATDGEMGIAAYRDDPFDIVITDIVMPNKAGIETIREMRGICAEVKIIAMSGGDDIPESDNVDIARQLGADAVLRKPFRMNVLREAVNLCLVEGAAD